MSDIAASDIKIPLKKCWKVGTNTVVVIDKSLVRRLGLDEANTMFQEEVVDGGILLRVIRERTDTINQ